MSDQTGKNMIHLISFIFIWKNWEDKSFITQSEIVPQHSAQHAAWSSLFILDFGKNIEVTEPEHSGIAAPCTDRNTGISQSIQRAGSVLLLARVFSLAPLRKVCTSVQTAKSAEIKHFRRKNAKAFWQQNLLIIISLLLLYYCPPEHTKIDR